MSNSICNFRARADLLEKLKKAAKAGGVNVSEFIRESLEMRLDDEKARRRAEALWTSSPDEKVQA